MKAIGFNAPGGPEVLTELEISTPKPSSNEVLIKLEMTSVNRLDTMVRNGVPGFTFNFPHIPGMDVLGRVEEIGADVKNFSKGDLVIANTVYGCGKCSYCKNNTEQLCPLWKCLGLHINGSYGEFIVLPERILLKAPNGFSKSELASMPLHASLSWNNIKKLGNAVEGETILIRAASGSTGLFAIKFSKALNLKIIAISGSVEKHDKLRSLGADLVLSSELSKAELSKQIMSFTNTAGVDIIMESTGSKLGESVELAAYNARIISFGVLMSAESTLNIRRLYLRNITIHGTHNASKVAFDEAFEFASKKNIKPIIGKILDIQKASEAHKLLEERKVFGKIVLKHW